MDLKQYKILHGPDLQIHTLDYLASQAGKDPKLANVIVLWFLSRILQKIGLSDKSPLNEKSVVVMVKFLEKIGAETGLVP